MIRVRAILQKDDLRSVKSQGATCKIQSSKNDLRKIESPENDLRAIDFGDNDLQRE